VLVLDANVLIYAHRLDTARHEEYARWLGHALDGPEPVGVPWLVLAAVVRICTNQRVFEVPSTLDEVFSFCDEVLSGSAAAHLESGPGHWRTFRLLCEATRMRGPHVTDAFIAALAIDSRSELITTDAGFARFPGLRWRHPLG
jgi:uncharacterized protein